MNRYDKNGNINRSYQKPASDELISTQDTSAQLSSGERQEALLRSTTTKPLEQFIKKNRSKLHTARMAELGRKQTVAEETRNDSLLTSGDAVLRPSDGSDNIITIGKDLVDISNESGRGGLKITPQKALIKASAVMEFDNDYRQFTMGDKQFNQSVHKDPLSVIFSMPLVDQQLFPAELRSIAGIAATIKKSLGLE